MSNEYPVDLAKLLESSIDSIVFVDKGLCIRYVNSGFLGLFGYGETNVLGKDVASLYPDELKKEREEWYRNLLDGKKIKNYRTTIYNGKGELVDISLSLSLVKDDNGNVLGTVGNAKDITETVKIENELKRSLEELKTLNQELEKSNQMKGLFVDILGHDLLNPVSIIGNSAEIMKDDGDMSPHAEELLEIIEKTTKNLEERIKSASRLAYIKDLKDFKMSRTDLNYIIRSVMPNIISLYEEKGLTLTYKDSKDSFINADPLIEDIFFNLLSNAAKYTPKGGKVEVLVEDTNECYRVHIKDTGEGVPDEYKKSIFNRLTRVSKKGVKGTGIGLAIVEKVVGLHNGKVWVEDNPEGQGSVFVVELPKSDSNQK